MYKIYKSSTGFVETFCKKSTNRLQFLCNRFVWNLQIVYKFYVTVLYKNYKSVTSLGDSRVESTANKVMVQSLAISLPLTQPVAVVMDIKRLLKRAMNWRELFFC